MCNLNCPAPLLGAKHVVDELQPGQTMRLISDCPGTPDDLFAWSRHTGNEVIATDRLAEHKMAYSIKRGSGGAARPAANVTLDLRGVSCPGPIVQAKKLLDGMRGGGPASGKQLPGVPRRHSWVKSTLELVQNEETAPGTYEFSFAKPRPERPAL